MRRFIETVLLLFLCFIPLGSAAEVAERMPMVLAAVSLAFLTLYSPLRRSEYALGALFVLLWILVPEAAFFAPLMAYGLLQKNRPLVLVPILITLLPFHPVSFVLSGLAVWMAWQELSSREREQAYFAMRDDFVQNELLLLRVRQEEALNHEKNLEIAVLQERNRISREIHDSVGHTISAALLQIEALKLSAQEPARTRLDYLSKALASGMEEVRNSLHNLHSESISIHSEISRLTESLAQSYEIDERIQIEDAPLPVKRAMLALVREALTNISRHSDATKIRILLRELPRHYTVTVKDNGSQKPVKTGIGLSSMEEMSRSLGGVFTHGWSDGFFVHMTIPRERDPDQITDSPATAGKTPERGRK